MLSLSNIKLFSLCAIVITIVLSRLNLNSNFLVLLAFAWLLEGRFKKKMALLKKDKLFLAYLLYFIIQIAGVTMSDNLMVGWKEFESKVGFLVVPLVLCSAGLPDRYMRKKIMMVFSLAVLVAGLFCIGVSGFNYVKTQDESIFFYHQLVSPLDHHAVYFAVFTFICLVFLMTEIKDLRWFKTHRFIYIAWLVFYLVLLFLLSSKMVLFITVLFLLYRLIVSARSIRARMWRTSIGGLAMLLIVAAIFVTDNPVKKRFADLKGDIELLSLVKYNDAMYFNGWQFRLLLWRFTFEIIRDKNAWLTGVGPTNDQAALREKYLAMGLYSGLKSRGDQGYLEFNCHNQFLQSTLQSGIPGLLIFVAWCVIFVVRVVRKEQEVLSWMCIIILAFFFTESVFERQYGMILTTLLPLMYLYTKKPRD